MSRIRGRRQPNLQLDDVLKPEKLRALKSGTDVEVASYKGENLQMEARLRVRPAFEEDSLHPKIVAATKALYRDAHYRDAVLGASIALIKLVQTKSRRPDLDGVALMSTVFSKNKPILAINKMKDKTDWDEQEGMMHLLMGAVLAIRNPRAHGLFADDPESALEYIGFISMLAKRVDRAKRVTS